MALKTSPASRGKGRSPTWPAGNPLAGGPLGTAPARFDLAVERDGAMLLLRLRGEFDLSVVGRVEEALELALGASVEHIVFDLRDVAFLDLAGLMTVLRVNERSRAAPFDVKVVPPTGLARRVFTLTRAGTELTMIDAPPA